METGFNKPRKVSRFFAHEMLYDYLEDRLDPIRRKAVDEAVKNDPQLNIQLEVLRSAQEYCKTMAGTRLNKEFILQLAVSKGPLDKVAESLKWQRWPDALKWTAEGLAVSLMVAVLAMAIPWQDIANLTNVEAPKAPTVVSTSEKPAPAPAEPPEEKAAEPKIETKTPVVAAIPPAQEKPVETPIPTSKPPEAAKPTTVASAETDEDAETPPPKQAAAQKGLIYRMMMKVPEVKDKASALRDRLVELGGKKAGQVELGWRKPNGNYFHFSMPESNYDELIKTLGTYGPVRIYKNPHPRVMPDGVIRIILWIEDAPVAEPVTEPGAEEPAETAPVDGEATPEETGNSNEDTPEA